MLLIFSVSPPLSSYICNINPQVNNTGHITPLVTPIQRSVARCLLHPRCSVILIPSTCFPVQLPVLFLTCSFKPPVLTDPYYRSSHKKPKRKARKKKKEKKKKTETAQLLVQIQSFSNGLLDLTSPRLCLLCSVRNTRCYFPLQKSFFSFRPVRRHSAPVIPPKPCVGASTSTLADHLLFSFLLRFSFQFTRFFSLFFFSFEKQERT